MTRRPTNWFRRAAVRRGSQANYTLEITVTDDGEPPLSRSGNTTVIVVDSNDAPFFELGSPVFAIAELQPVNSTLHSTSFNLSGLAVAHVPASDVDNKDKLTYSLLTNDGGMFGVDPKSGDIYVKYPPNFEFRSSYSFRLQVRAANPRVAMA